MNGKNKLETAADVIDAAGGTTKVARRFGVPSQAVSAWKKRGFLPPDTYLAWQEILSDKGKCAPPELWRQRETIA